MPWSRWSLANSPLGHGVPRTSGRRNSASASAAWQLDKPLEWWVNDGLMTVFFFVVGLEIKRELVAGELRTRAEGGAAGGGGGRRDAGAGRGVPAVRAHRAGPARGWGIPMATDIAFVVGVMAAFGKRVPFGLKIFLLSLAIADDMGAVLVIAVAYTEHLNLVMLAAGGRRVRRHRGCSTGSACGRWRCTWLVGAATWLAMYKSGVHPTIAGVLLGLLTPYRAWLGRDTLRLALDDVAGRLNDSATRRTT